MSGNRSGLVNRVADTNNKVTVNNDGTVQLVPAGGDRVAAVK